MWGPNNLVPPVNQHENSEISAAQEIPFREWKVWLHGAVPLIVPCSVCGFPSHILPKSHIATNTHLGFDCEVSSIYMYKIEPTVTD